YKINDLITIFKTYQQNYNEIKIIFTQTYYNPFFNGQLSVDFQHSINITLIGEPSNGTVIDCGHDFHNNFHITFQSQNKNDFLNFNVENIKFYDFFDSNHNGKTSLFFIEPISPKFTVSFKNCTFESSNTNLFRFNINVNKDNDIYQYKFDDCNFINLINGTISTESQSINSNAGNIKISHSYFNNASDLFHIKNGNLFIEDCVHNKAGYLIYFNNKNIKNNNKIIINNSKFKDVSTLISGDGTYVILNNLEISDINNENSFELISNIKYGIIDFKNSIVSNITFRGYGLIGGESEIRFQNITFTNIISNYNVLIPITYHDGYLEDIIFENINLIGDEGLSSLIYFNSNEIKIKKSLLLKNIAITNIHSNGSLIILEGNKVNLTLSNIDLNVTDTLIENVENLHKMKIGLFNINNEMSINSEFNNNTSYNNGGVLSITSNNRNDNIQNSNIKLTLINSILTENVAKYFGGVFYLNMNNTYDYLFNINNNLFENNTAGVAGGVFFFANYFQKYKPQDFQNNNFFKNNNANSHGNKFASNPSIIQYNDTNELKEEFKVISGNPINFNIQVHDGFNNLIVDNEKYYSNLNFLVDMMHFDGKKMESKEYIIKNNIISIEHGKTYNILNNIL
ncbi:hypothetical protein PIROE2DRAFT_3009, partial [Piromyces sp. E2]